MSCLNISASKKSTQLYGVWKKNPKFWRMKKKIKKLKKIKKKKIE